MERRYVIPLRKEFLKVPKYLRTRKAIKAIQKFIARHMKTDDVRIGKYLNLQVWTKGNRNPPHHVEILAEEITHKDKGKETKFVRVELVGAPKEEKAEEGGKKKLVDKLKEKIAGKEDVKKVSKETIEGEKKMEGQKEEQKAMIKEEEKLLESKKAPKHQFKDTARKMHDQTAMQEVAKRNMKSTSNP